ncbi:hypothetical protein Nepgr_019048 [Nepenthes gracilis]|uniref:Uncharacterized protein n=1 Tax=Nepenthes gracilis TaxID=150966 RepID=A0AAD3SV64_NEPGR|nr:hypothetical protein Nepgr_019048 [Nepenthes gracilis]
MGPDSDLKRKSDMAMDVSLVKVNGDACKVPEEKPIICAYNDINITERTNSGEKELVKGDQDATESSSSFGNTDSGIGNAAVSSDVEVESEWRDDGTSTLTFDGCGDLLQKRRKKLTSHWRKFVRPLTWRCKWVELQLKELWSQAVKYDRELAECSQRKQRESEKFRSQDLSVKAVPTFCQSQKVIVFRRKKRRRVEETTNIVSYMKRHNLFSYYVNKKSFVDCAYMDDDCGNSVALVNKSNFINDEFGVDGEWLPLEFKDGNSFEEILQKIEDAQLLLRSLTVRMDKVICENSRKFTPSDYSSFLAPSAAPNLEFPRLVNEEILIGNLYATLLHTSENKLGDQFIPESTVSSFGKATPLPDMIESTDRLNGCLSCVKIKDQILEYNGSVKEELHYIKEIGFRPAPSGKPRSPSAVPAGAAQHLLDQKPDLSRKSAVPIEQRTVRMRSISKLITPNNKRKRRSRKARSSRWNRRSS